MLIRVAALAACWLAMASAPALAAERLTLDDAIRRVELSHPDLRLTGARKAILSAEMERASLRPPLVLGATLENFMGTGERRFLDNAEATVTLASVFERGGKLDARKTLAQTRIDALGVVLEGLDLAVVGRAEKFLGEAEHQGDPKAVERTGLWTGAERVRRRGRSRGMSRQCRGRPPCGPARRSRRAQGGRADG